jgi:hypothetical protein
VTGWDCPPLRPATALPLILAGSFHARGRPRGRGRRGPRRGHPVRDARSRGLGAAHRPAAGAWGRDRLGRCHAALGRRPSGTPPYALLGSLFGHLIARPAGLGAGLRLADRTNNALEGLSQLPKHDQSRHSGHKILTQDLEQLPSAFAAPDAPNTRRSAVVAAASQRSRTEAECDVVSASLPKADRRVVRDEVLCRRIKAAARSRAPRR